MLSQIPFQQNGAPGFIADVKSREHVLAGGAKVAVAQFVSADAVKVTVGVAGAAADAVLVPVTALTEAIPAGTTLPFGGKKFATLTANAAKGAVQLAVSALPTALVSGDTAYYSAPGTPKRIPSGTLVGLTNAELEGASVVTAGIPAGALWGKAEDADDVIRLTVYDIPDADKSNDVDLLRPGTLIYVNHLPGWSALSAALKNKIRATYEVTTGATEV